MNKLNDKQIKNLIKLYRQTKNISIRDQIFQYHYQYLCKLVTKFNKRYDQKHDPDDLKQYASIGLLRAIELHNIEGPAKFSTYMYLKCIGAILDGLKKQKKSKKDLNIILQLLQNSANAIRQRQSRQPNLDELILIATLDTDQIKVIQYHTSRHQKQSQFDSVLDELIQKEERGQFQL